MAEVTKQWGQECPLGRCCWGAGILASQGEQFGSPGEGMVAETWEGEEGQEMSVGHPGFVDSNSYKCR